MDRAAEQDGNARRQRQEVELDRRARRVRLAWAVPVLAEKAGKYMDSIATSSWNLAGARTTRPSRRICDREARGEGRVSRLVDLLDCA